MNDWTGIARQALRGALETRRHAGIGKSDPICVYDLAERLGVEVRFCGGKSFEGMYVKSSQTILVPALRPQGRQAFSCGHELGHWFFSHGTHVHTLDDVDRKTEDTEERLANVFAGYLLMPPWAVNEAFAKRKWDPSTCRPLEAYRVALQLGVGYSTLIHHLQWSLGLVTPNHAEELSMTTPKQLRRSILGNDNARHLVIADKQWTKVSVDFQVGDKAILPKDVVLEGMSARVIGTHELGIIVEGRVPGISRAESREGSWAAYLRVSRLDFHGRSRYRHMEDPDVYEDAGTDL